jgi:maleylacetoacetate isomerase/maleylpyruvate isomerase
MELFAYWRSQAGFRVRVALNLKRVAFHETVIDLDKGDQHAPGFRALNPQGAVPALVEDGQAPITQSLAILEYLEERYPEPPLLPSDLPGRARVRSLACLAAADTHPLFVPRVRAYLVKHDGYDAGRWRAWLEHWLLSGLRTFETRLAREPQTGAFCHGDRVTIADLCLAGLAATAEVFKVEIAGMPTVERIVARCSELDAFRRAHPLAQPGAPMAA